MKFDPDLLRPRPLERWPLAPELPMRQARLVYELGSRQRLATLLGVDITEIALRERQRRLFSLMPEGCGAPLYPLFQALPGVNGPPLAGVLAEVSRHMALGEPSPEAEWLRVFLLAPHPVLADAAPLEVLMAQRVHGRALSLVARRLFDCTPPTRLRAVQSAARGFRPGAPRPLRSAGSARSRRGAQSVGDVP